MNRQDDNNYEASEQNSRSQPKGPSEPDAGRKGRFGLLTDPIKGFKSENITRPLTGLFRKSGKSTKKTENDDIQEPTVAAPPTNFPNMARISATIESVQMSEEYNSHREYNAETGSKTTLSDGIGFGNQVQPLARYLKVGDIDMSLLGRTFPTERSKDEEVSWTAQSLLSNLETRIKKERMEAKDNVPESRMRVNREPAH
ncbi:hypothetical protein L5515_014685 [Caenorhabditis briggsae]|uniref:Uncharacterized protein n=2 Tax=Caenorhabditis briggsae TaxID=6238 RepID=A0AAE9E9U4_CAEBR|nr:hypothetical protein L5515_014685 [Caenorhabditis briggsae]